MRDAAEDASRDFCPAGVINDGAAASADFVEEPHVGLRIPRFARRAENAQAREVVPADWLRAEWNQRADKRRRDAEVRDAMAFDERPEAVRLGIIRRAFVKNHCRAESESAENRPRAHHPTEIREPEKDF